jgi:CP family cyanate transporter-like MFS transporter
MTERQSTERQSTEREATERESTERRPLGPSSIPAWRGIAGIIVVGLFLRTQLTVIGPLIPSIQADLGIVHATAGLLTALPVLCMGLAALGVSRLVAGAGAGLVIGAGLGLVGVAGILRAVAPDAVPVLLATLAIGIGIGIGGASIPVVVKAWFPARPATATGTHVTAIIFGSVLVAATAVPIAESLGSWRWPLAIMSVATLLGAVAWLGLSSARPSAARGGAGATALPVRSRLAWLLVALFCLQSLLFFGLATWLPSAYVERGWSEAAAASLVAVLIATGLPAAVGVGWLSDRVGSRRAYLMASSIIALSCCVGFIVAPDLGFPLALIVGLPLGALFSLVLTLPLDASSRPTEVAPLTGLMLGVGYLVAGTAPVAMGAIRDAVGTFEASLGLLVVAAALLTVLASLVTDERLEANRIVDELPAEATLDARAGVL